MSDCLAERMAVTRFSSRAVWIAVKRAVKRVGSRAVDWVDWMTC